MIGGAGPRTPSLAEVRATVSTNLRARLQEIETKIFARVRAVSPPGVADDPAYVEGLRAAVNEAIEYTIDGIEEEREPEPIPRAVRVQARRAARAGISLDTVLRRYAAGDRLITEFIMDGADSLPRRALQQILRTQGAHIDHLMATTATEYMHESERVSQTPAQRLGEQVLRLLAGEEVAKLDVSYDFRSWHVGILARGAGVERAVADLGKSLDCDVLFVPAEDASETVWAWLGNRRPPATSQIAAAWPEGQMAVAVGEPREGLDGWRQTHREARSAFHVLPPDASGLVRSREVLLVAAALQDETISTALSETYLLPLEGRGDTGDVLRETLRAYFNAGQNAATAAAALNVNRHTVERRIRGVEERIGALINSCRSHLEIALAIEGIDDGVAMGSAAAPVPKPSVE